MILFQTPQVACDRLLNFRVEAKVAGKRIGDVLNRIHIAMPKQRAGERLAARPPVIPAGVIEARKRREVGEKRKTEKQLQEENGGAGERPSREESIRVPPEGPMEAIGVITGPDESLRDIVFFLLFTIRFRRPLT